MKKCWPYKNIELFTLHLHVIFLLVQLILESCVYFCQFISANILQLGLRKNKRKHFINYFWFKIKTNYSVLSVSFLNITKATQWHTLIFEYICFSSRLIWARCCLTASWRCKMLLRCSSGLLEISNWKRTRCFFSLCSYSKDTIKI